MKHSMIQLSTEKQLRIYMLPLRQKIMRTMHLEGKPMTAKQIADRLTIAPSSAKHHMKKLEEIGLLVFDHHESINGIFASYYRTTNVTVSIGQDRCDDLSGERDAYAQNMLAEAYEGYKNVVEKYRGKAVEWNGGDILSGIAHLTDHQAKQIREEILKFMQENQSASEVTKPWHYALVAYRVDLTGDGKD